MAFHIPFNQRETARQNIQPVYIGFEVQRPVTPKKKFNWWGFNGMWMSVASLFTVGFLSPVPLLVSLVGLRREGKKMAATGTVVSLAGVLLASSLVFGSIASENHREAARHARHQQMQIQERTKETQIALDAAAVELIEYRSQNDGELPNDIDANMLVLKHVDAWGQPIRYDAEISHGVIRSCGPDEKFDTKDDVTMKIKGQTERTPLLPLSE